MPKKPKAVSAPTSKSSDWQAFKEAALAKPPKPANVLTVPLADMDFHPLLMQVAMVDDAIAWLKKNRDADPAELAEKEGYRASFIASLKAEGIKTPVAAVRKGNRWLIVNGRHRVTYGREAGVLTAPVIEVGEDMARQTVLRENGLTWARTKAAIAWLAVCLTPEVVESKAGGDRDSDRIGMGITRTALAAQAGVSADLIDQACKLYKLVGKSKTARAAVESQVAAGCGLGGIIAGLAGKPEPNDDGKVTRPPSSVAGFGRTLSTFKTQLKGWEKWTPEQRDIAVNAAAAVIQKDKAVRDFWLAVFEAANAD